MCRISLSLICLIGSTCCSAGAEQRVFFDLDLSQGKCVPLWSTAEWSIPHPNLEGNPFDRVARVTFLHDASGETRSTEMFYDGRQAWRFRFAATRKGTWSFKTQADGRDGTDSDSELNGFSGKVVITEEVRRRVVWRPDFWLTGEAISTYVRSAGLFGNEMHSPIMCIGHGVPALVCRWAEQTTKGFMWEDIGLADWLFDLDDPSQVSRLVPTVLEIARDPESAKSKAARARDLVHSKQQQTMMVLSGAMKDGEELVTL